MKRYKEIEVKVGKFKVGLPGGNSYNEKTPSKLKTFGEGLLLLGGLIGLASLHLSPPGWLLFIGGASTLGGRFVIKCFSKTN